jgi:hypothetical protein
MISAGGQKVRRQQRNGTRKKELKKTAEKGFPYAAGSIFSENEEVFAPHFLIFSETFGFF